MRTFYVRFVCGTGRSIVCERYSAGSRNVVCYDVNRGSSVGSTYAQCVLCLVNTDNDCEQNRNQIVSKMDGGNFKEQMKMHFELSRKMKEATNRQC